MSIYRGGKLKQLKERREKLNLTQKQVAQRAGISERGYQNYELGIRIPNVYVAFKIAKALEISPIELYQE